MPSKDVKTVEKARCFTYRCFVNKQLQKPSKVSTLTKDFHLERMEGDEVKVVEDRPIDWVELSNRDVPNVGLANVLKLAAKGQVDLSELGTKDSECGDQSMLDPMDVNTNQKLLAKKDANIKKLEGIAKSLGVTMDQLTNSFLDGSFADLVAKAQEVKKEEKENA